MTILDPSWREPTCSGVRTPNFDLCNFPQRGLGHGHLEMSNSESFCQPPTESYLSWPHGVSRVTRSFGDALGNYCKPPTDLLKVCSWRGSSSWLEAQKKKKKRRNVLLGSCSAWTLQAWADEHSVTRKHISCPWFQASWTILWIWIIIPKLVEKCRICPYSVSSLLYSSGTIL